ncbi:MAG: glycosyltransferase [Pseudomonadota bacterium]
MKQQRVWLAVRLTMAELAHGGSGWIIGVLLHDFQLGGTERVAIRLANAWSRMGVRVILFAGGGGLQRELVADSVEVVIARPPTPRNLLNSTVKLGRWLAVLPEAECVDAFFLPGNSYFRAIAPLAAGGVPIYTTITNPLWRSDRSLWRNLLFTALTRLRLRKAAGVISTSPALMRRERQLLGKQRVSVALPNALFEGELESAAVARQQWHVCGVGRLVPQKNFALLLQSIALLQDLPVTLSIVGDGPELGGLRRLANALGIADRVRFPGAVANASMWLATAEVMVLTSVYEGYPAVAVEALAMGTFVVTGNCSPAMADILSNPALGVIVRENTAADFAHALRQYFNGKERFADARRRQATRALVQSHCAARAARHYLDFMDLDRPVSHV